MAARRSARAALKAGKVELKRRDGTVAEEMSLAAALTRLAAAPAGLSMAFSPFERLVALRYLRARRKEGFISVIAGFSLAGIALGVATLIIVMSVMNGFRDELLTRILGINGHVTVYGTGQPLTELPRP